MSDIKTDINSETYSYNLKKKIANHIQKINNKQQMTDIINIIKNNDNSEFITTSSDGTYIKFNYLSDNTYEKINEYLTNININIVNFTPISTSFVPYSENEEYNVKLNTKEKSLLNHQKYVDDIKYNNDN